MQRMVFCHIVMDVNRELQFLKLHHVESNVFLATVIYFLPNCFQQLLNFTPQYLCCSFPSFTTQGQRKALFPSFHLSLGPSLRTPGNWQRDQHKSHFAGSLTEGQGQDSQNGGVSNPKHAQEQL